MNKTTIFSAVFLSLALSFSCQAETVAKPATATSKAVTPAPVVTCPDKPKEHPNRACLNSVQINDVCMVYCGECPVVNKQC